MAPRNLSPVTTNPVLRLLSLSKSYDCRYPKFLYLKHLKICKIDVDFLFGLIKVFMAFMFPQLNVLFNDKRIAPTRDQGIDILRENIF